MRTVDIDVIKEYAAEDADVTLQLKNVFEPMLEETATRELFDNIETPAGPCACFHGSRRCAGSTRRR